MFRNWQDLQDLLSNAATNVAKARQEARARQGDAAAPANARRGKGGGKARGPAPPCAPDTTPFAELWKAHCSLNQRLRDPRKLSQLMRRGVPEDLRPEVWSHTLGLEIASQPEAAARGSDASPTVSSTAVSTAVAEADSAPAFCGDQERSNASGPDAEEGSENKVQCSAEEVGTEERTEEQSDAAEAPVVKVLSYVDDADLPTGISEIIDADVARTFPSCTEFKRRGGHPRLRGVLRSFAAADIKVGAADARIGYCQSLNFIAAIFIMVFADDRVVVDAIGKTLVKLGIRRWYVDGMTQLRADTIVLEDLIRECLPRVHEVLTLHKFDLLFVSSKWFLCLFTTVLEGETIKRVWDIMLCDGIEAVFRIALALLARKEDVIVRAKSFDELIFMFQEGQCDAQPEGIVRAAYDPELVGSLSRAELSKRRQQALARVSSTDTKAEMRRLRLIRGGVRPASILAQ